MSTQEFNHILFKTSFHDDIDEIITLNQSSIISSSGSSSCSSDLSFQSTEDEPPSYECDNAFQLVPPYFKIFPREEEGNEDLPNYSCTVYKRGYVYLKQEYDTHKLKSKRRLWRKVYLELWGTSLQIYKLAPRDRFRWLMKSPPRALDPMFIISLAGADAARALDYFKRPDTLRLVCVDGLQFIIQASSHIDMISWIEHLQAAINISLDLESRPMPRFVTMPAREFTHNALLDQRLIELERAREQRRRNQHEVLI